MESLIHIRAFATEVFGAEEEADAWLGEKNAMLNNRIPLELLDTDYGTQIVENLLGRIAHGILS